MKITFYGYNTFLIDWGTNKIAIDPGASFYMPDFFKTLIPKAEWRGITHIFVTHGDPDHHWHTDRIANASGAKVICNEKMVRTVNDENLMLGPRSRGLTFSTPIKDLYTVAVDETIIVDDLEITGVKGTHGPLTLKVGPFSKTLHEGPEERFGYGEIGFQIKCQDRTILNLGDTILYEDEWKELQSPDVLMIPIGGRIAGNTMDEKEALKAVQVLKPKVVIPVHYNGGAMFNKCYNAADDQLFKKEAEEMGVKCIILEKGESTHLEWINKETTPEYMLD
ncbi:MAG: MBL fold metallo-hydrolase [Cyclobacteriaceae bacterium]